MPRNDVLSAPTRTLTGLLGDSDRAGFQRLYFARDRGYHAEFRAEDVVGTAPVPPDEQPLAGAMRVTVRDGASMEYGRPGGGEPPDEYDIDVQPGQGTPASAPHVPKLTDSCAKGCGPGETADTCDTRCEQATCRETCFPATCEGATCDRATCQGEECDGTAACDVDTSEGKTCQGGDTCDDSPTCETQCEETRCIHCQIPETSAHMNTCHGFNCTDPCIVE
jgi:hypothetical protein